MPELRPKFITDYFNGIWTAKVFSNGQFERNIVIQWHAATENSCESGYRANWKVALDMAMADGLKLEGISFWKNDIRRWSDLCCTESGGYKELQWTSMKQMNGIDVLFGFIHECDMKDDDPAEHIALCELYDVNKFKFTSQSYKSGIMEVIAKRSQTTL
ncbi:MAG: hypothetical protein WA988_12090 [Candidatus Nanopelagicales bacterium]